MGTELKVIEWNVADYGKKKVTVTGWKAVPVTVTFFSYNSSCGGAFRTGSPA
jgi:predicted outer membrane repeat protein